MAPLTPPSRSRVRIALALAVPCLLVGLAALIADSPPGAAPTATAASAPQASRIAATAPSPDDWTSLSPAHRRTLQPLQSRWAALTPTLRAQWLKVADDLEGRPAVELRHAQSHMRDWAGLSRMQRAQARRRFKSESRIAADERHRRWLAYSRRRDATTTPAPNNAAAAPNAPGVDMNDKQDDAPSAAPAPARTTVRQTIVPNPSVSKGESS